jgi:hypothetical protein
MRKMGVLLALALMVPMLATAQSTWTDAPKGTWTGLVVEQSCYAKDGYAKAVSAEHMTCALDCLKQGKALALVTDDDGVRQIMGALSKDNYAKMTQWIGKRVTVTGATSHDAFSARFIEIKTIAAAK